MRLKWQVGVTALAVLAWLLAFAGPGLHAWFTYDDLMNLYSASHRTALEILASPSRPFADLVNRALWLSFGFHPERFRLVCFALLAGGIALGSALAWRLSGSGSFALLFVTLFSYHAYLSDLYFNSGAIYDLLCLLFYFGALFWYAGIRRALRSPTWPASPCWPCWPSPPRRWPSRYP